MSVGLGRAALISAFWLLCTLSAVGQAQCTRPPDFEQIGRGLVAKLAARLEEIPRRGDSLRRTRCGAHRW